MKTKFFIICLTILTSLTSLAWSIGGMSCSRNLNSLDANQFTQSSIQGTSFTQQTYLKNPNAGNANAGQNTPIQDQYTAQGTYGSVEKVNVRTVMVGLFNFVQIYDGLNFEAGHLQMADGSILQSRIEVRFQAYDDLAYGPDFADFEIQVRASDNDAWSTFESLKHCFVSLSH